MIFLQGPNLEEEERQRAIRAEQRQRAVRLFISIFIRNVLIAIGLVAIIFGLVVLYQLTSRKNVLVHREVGADVKYTREEVAKSFVSAVVICISPQILPDQNLTEQQVDERITAAIANCFPPKEDKEDPKWTFEAPCKIKINKSLFVLGGEVKIGDIEICKITIVAGIIAGYNCRKSIDVRACLTNSVMETDDVKKEIDKPVKFQYI